jgi:hypothetical protein
MYLKVPVSFLNKIENTEGLLCAVAFWCVHKCVRNHYPELYILFLPLYPPVYHVYIVPQVQHSDTVFRYFFNFLWLCLGVVRLSTT